MKKLFYIPLLLSLCFSFSACGGDDDDEDDNNEFVWNGDWNDPNDPNFKKEGYNPIKGRWAEFEIPTLMYEFTEDFKQISYVYNGTEWIPHEDISTYKINDTAIKYSLTIKAYTITKENGRDILYLHEVSTAGNKQKKYYRYDNK